jgi:hypothetical protein
MSHDGSNNHESCLWLGKLNIFKDCFFSKVRSKISTWNEIDGRCDDVWENHEWKLWSKIHTVKEFVP